MKKIIFINQYVTHLFVDIINDFADHGVHVTLVTGSIHSSNELSGEVKIIKFNKYRRDNIFSRLITWLLFGTRVFFYLLTKRVPVFLTTNPPFLPIIGYFYNRVKKQDFDIVIYDLYPDALDKMGYMEPGNILYRLWEYLNRKSFIAATNVFTISEFLSRGIEKYIELQKRIHVVHAWADSRFIRPMERNKNPFAIKYELEKKFVVLYSGNLGLTHDIETILQAAHHIQYNDAIKFIIIGEGARKRSVEITITELGLKNVLVLPWQDADQLPYTFSSADIGVVTLGKGAEGLSVPSKTYSYLSAGCALLAIAPRNSEIGELIHQYKTGEIFEPGDAEGVSGFILKLQNESPVLEIYKKNSLEASHKFGIENSKLFYPVIYVHR